MSKPSLTAQAWIEAGFRALTKGGPQAIRVEAIARDLKVSKGSFYWHFENAGTLKSQMLQLWKAEATVGIISRLEESGLSGPDKLRLLVDLATGDKNAPYGGVLAEAAIRDWARFDDLASKTVGAVDRQRLNFLEALFTECGVTAQMARTQSTILYGALIGLEALSHRGMARLKEDLRCLLEMLLRV